MTTIEKKAWISLKKVINSFLAVCLLYSKSINYETIVNSMLKKLLYLGLYISTKMHFLHPHLGKCPENLENVSEEHGERFYYNIN